MRGNSIVTGVNLRGPQVSQLSIAWCDTRFTIQRLHDFDEASEHLGIVGEHSHHIEDGEAHCFDFAIRGAYLWGGFGGFNQRNPGHGFLL